MYTLAWDVIEQVARVKGEELLSWCREHIAEYKAPRHVEIRDEMPYGMTLKVLKRMLRDELAQKVDVENL